MSTSSRPGMLMAAIPDRLTLYKSYMGFLKNGGLFVPTQKSYRLGEEVFVLVQLKEDNSKLPISGRVAWINTMSGQTGKPQGIGVQFLESMENEEARSKIEVMLAGLATDKPTYTM